jgi:hypothetical protein
LGEETGVVRRRFRAKRDAHGDEIAAVVVPVRQATVPTRPHDAGATTAARMPHSTPGVR